MDRKEVFKKVNAYVRQRGWCTDECGGAVGAALAALVGLGLLKLDEEEK